MSKSVPFNAVEYYDKVLSTSISTNDYHVNPTVPDLPKDKKNYGYEVKILNYDNEVTSVIPSYAPSGDFITPDNPGPPLPKALQLTARQRKYLNSWNPEAACDMDRDGIHWTGMNKPLRVAHKLRAKCKQLLETIEHEWITEEQERAHQQPIGG